MPSLNMNPDAFLRERVFQRIVDVGGIDPQAAARRILLFHVVGTTSACAAIWLVLAPRLAAANISVLLPAVLFVPLVLNGLSVGRQLHLPAVASLDPVNTARRIILTVLIAFTTFFAVEGLRAGWPRGAQVLALALALAWPAGPIAWYLHLCRKPPRRPRRPRSRISGREVAARAR